MQSWGELGALRSKLREFVIGPVTAVVGTFGVLALVGALLVLLEPHSPSAGGLTTSISAPTAPFAVAPGRYGSGTLGPWQNLLRRITPDDEIRDVLTFNGVFLFGDSIAVQDSAALEQLLAARTGDSIAEIGRASCRERVFITV